MKFMIVKPSTNEMVIPETTANHQQQENPTKIQNNTKQNKTTNSMRMRVKENCELTCVRITNGFLLRTQNT